jgi:hypothetical protein
MTNKTLLDRLTRLGLPLMKTTETFDVNETLADVLKNRDPRLWEGFPVVLLNAAKDNNFNYARVADNLTAVEKKRLHGLLLLSLALYGYYHLSTPWMNQLKAGFSTDEKNVLKRLRNSLVNNDPVQVEGFRFHAERLKKIFELYFEKEAGYARQKKDKYDELSLEYSLSQVFSPKQKELLKKKFEGVLLSKTEREYYSRAVKKKVVALANSELHHMAQQLVQR